MENLAEEGLAELARMLRVIADENRLRILALLVRQETCVCDIMEKLDLSQPLASHHLGVLRQAGVGLRPPRCTVTYYSIARSGWPVSALPGIVRRGQPAAEAAYGAPHR